MQFKFTTNITSSKPISCLFQFNVDLVGMADNKQL